MNQDTPAATAAGAFHITIYTRRDCHLCDEARAAVSRAAADVSVTIETSDVDADPDLQRRFGHEVPVVFLDGRKVFKFRVDEARLRRLLAGR